MSADTERAAIGVVMMDKTCLASMPELEPKHFADRRHGRIFARIVRMYKDGDDIDFTTVGDKLEASGEIDELGGKNYLSSFTDFVATLSHANGYAKAIIDDYNSREMCNKMKAIISRLESGESPAELMGEISSLPMLSGNQVREVTIKEAFDDLEKYQLGQKPGIIDIGFDALVKYSPAADELLIIAARPSTGKTALAIELSERISRHMPLLFISLEMSGRGIHFRRLSYSTGIGSLALKTKGGLSAANYAKITSAFGNMHKNKNLIIYQGYASAVEIVGLIRSEIVRRGVGAFVVDHLGKVKLPGKQRHDIELGEVTAGLAGICKEHSVLGLVLHQLSRKSEDRDSKRPMLSDLRDSGRIEQDADHVWLLHRPGRYDDDPSNRLEVSIAKNRDGPIGSVELRYTDSGRIVE